MTNKTLWIFLIVSCVFGPAFAGQVEDDILRGSQLAQKKDYDGAAKEFEKALKYDPKNAKAHLLLGLTYANQGNLDKALQFTKYAIMLEKSYAAFHNLGLIYANKGEYQNAVEAYESALKLNPSSANAWYQLGLLHSGNGHFSDGITAYKKAVELNPYLDSALLGLGSAYYWSGDESSARAQVTALKNIKMKDKAELLEAWINKNDEKKRDSDASVKAAAPAEPPVLTPAPTATPAATASPASAKP